MSWAVLLGRSAITPPVVLLMIWIDAALAGSTWIVTFPLAGAMTMSMTGVGTDDIPFGLALTITKPFRVFPAGRVKVTLSGVVPVATPVELQFVVRAKGHVAGRIGELNDRIVRRHLGIVAVGRALRLRPFNCVPRRVKVPSRLGVMLVTVGRHAAWGVPTGV